MMDLETYARDLANARKSAWSWKKAADRRLELLVMAEQTLRNIGANLPPESDLAQIAKNAAFNIKKELDDTALGS